MAFVCTHSNLCTPLTHSPAGSGKTVLCSIVIETMQDVCKSFPDRKMAYFYFDFQDYEKQKTEPLLRSLLRQLIADELNIPRPIIELYTAYKDKGQSPSLKDLESVLSLIVEESSKDTYIIIDALDEFPEWTTCVKRAEMLRTLTTLMDNHPSKLHVLATSRDETDIRTALERIPCCEVLLQAANIDLDIKLYVRTFLNNNLERFNNFPETLKIEIDEALCQGAHGM
jgi:ATP/maltotriose-dependent transcriptional regulator MalT